MLYYSGGFRGGSLGSDEPSSPTGIQGKALKCKPSAQYNAIPCRAVRARANETIAHALIKYTCNGGIRNITIETITCNGPRDVYEKLLKEKSRSLCHIASYFR